ncbi:Hypothetical predicted protein [Mytilus galloprovincialis]|uniref:B box-type domain-containing protein n=1 Tax=Mytilus galloprovincialis TaxID=29158 RepID=A0A8B6BXS8_MYTGA|nr:Hypothetical predicted protein [Mytilus galloprovincialis]
MASNFPVCGVCISRHASVQSAAWCFECNTGLCGECKEHHLLNEAHKSHGILPLTEYQTLPVSVLQITDSCKLHGENYQAYCHEHECSCCTKCLIEEHRNCQNLTNIHDGVCKFSSSKTFFEIESSLQELSENLKRIQKNREENMSSLQLDRKYIHEEIRKARHVINEHFDRIEGELLKELIKVEDTERRKINNILASVERTEKIVVELQMTLAISKQHASDQQTFHISKHIQHILMDTNNIVQSMHDNNELLDVNISLRMNDIGKIVKTNITKIGEIVIQPNPVYTALSKREYKEVEYADLHRIDEQTSSEYTSLTKQKNKEADYSKLGENDKLTSSDYTSLIKQKNKEAEYSKLGENDEQITQAYTSLIPQENKEEAYTELSEIIEKTIPVHASPTGQENKEVEYTELAEIVETTSLVPAFPTKQENKEEAYTEPGEIVEKTDSGNMSLVRQKHKQDQSNVSTCQPTQENEYETVQTTQHDTELCFIVRVKPGKDALKFGLNNKYRLYVKPDGFTLEDIKKRTLKCHWPYEIVQQYGKSKEGREIVIAVEQFIFICVEPFRCRKLKLRASVDNFLHVILSRGTIYNGVTKL